MEEVNRSRVDSQMATPLSRQLSESAQSFRQGSGIARRLADELHDQYELGSPQQRSRHASCLSISERVYGGKEGLNQGMPTSVEQSQYDQILAKKTAQIEMLETRLRVKQEELLKMEARCLELYDNSKVASLWNKLYSVCEELSSMSPPHVGRKVQMRSETSSVVGENTIVRGPEIDELHLPEHSLREPDELQTRRVSHFEREMISTATLPMVQEQITTQGSLEGRIAEPLETPMQYIPVSHESSCNMYLEEVEEEQTQDDYFPVEEVRKEPPPSPARQTLQLKSSVIDMAVKEASFERKFTFQGAPTNSEAPPILSERSIKQIPSVLQLPEAKCSTAKTQFKAAIQLQIDMLIYCCKLQSQLSPGFLNTQLPFIKRSIEDCKQCLNQQFRQLQSNRLDSTTLETDALSKMRSLLCLIKEAGSKP